MKSYIAKGYNTVHDINERVKRAVSSSEKYAKGFSKAFLHAGGQYLKSVFPAPVAMYETNKELLSDTVKFLRNPIDSINRQVNRALETDDFKALKEFADAVDEAMYQYSECGKNMRMFRDKMLQLSVKKMTRSGKSAGKITYKKSVVDRALALQKRTAK